MSEIKIENLEVQWINPKLLKPHPKNPNKHPKSQIEQLADSYKKNGIRKPLCIVSNRSNCVIAGCGRLEAAILAEINKIPVIYQDFGSDEAEYQFMIVDNSLGQKSYLDFGEINKTLMDYGPEINLDDLYIEDFYLDPSEKFNAGDEWIGMPEFSQEDLTARFRITVNFMTQEDMEDFAKLVGQTITLRTKSIYYPKQEVDEVKDLRY